jgi:taurine dioxygenase
MSQSMTIRRTAGALGAEIGGLDLSRELSDGQIAQIRRAFLEHQVIFFRDQDLTPAQQVAFGARFGPLNIHPYVAGMKDFPPIMEVIKEPHETLNFGGGWHSDMSFLERPAIGSILYAVEVPEFGGDTLFASQAAAYDALSAGLKQTLEGLNAVHSAAREYSSQGHSAQKRSSMAIAEADGLVGEYVHPMVLAHPETGRKALYVNPAFTMRIEGWKTAESKALLDYLFQHCRYEGFTTRFSWRKGSIAFWDNRSVWHFALNDYHGQRRHMRRVTVDPWPQMAKSAKARVGEAVS